MLQEDPRITLLGKCIAIVVVKKFAFISNDKRAPYIILR